MAFESTTYAQLPDAPPAASSPASASGIPVGETAGSSAPAPSFSATPSDQSSSADFTGDDALPSAPVPAEADPVLGDLHSGPLPQDERYHWGALFRQSLEFTGVEDTYRLVTDPFMRHLIANGPYWHNYMASLQQWNMRRWNDGDDFLVDYIGHPMQGGVSGFIEIQNSPRQRYLRISPTKEYWNSRVHALLWSTVFSTQQKIGPLGEAALGSAGGYTYALHCPYPCAYKPGVTKYTNNTGWTDFITTPVIGTLWTVLEDFLDKEVSDPIADRLPGRLAGNIVRGSLNPTRTMANFMRGKNPWYRDWQHRPEIEARLPRDRSSQSESGGYVPPRYELFPHLDAISLPVNTDTCSHCRQMLYGPGVGFSAAFSRWFDFDSDVNFHSDASPLPSDRAGGNMVMGTFGLRSGWKTERFALRASIRPGFLTYDKAYETSPSKTNPTPEIGRITHFVTALAISSDLEFSSHLGFRFVVENVPVRYRTARLEGERPGHPPYLNWLSREIFATNENWATQSGVVLRF